MSPTDDSSLAFLIPIFLSLLTVLNLIYSINLRRFTFPRRCAKFFGILMGFATLTSVFHAPFWVAITNLLERTEAAAVLGFIMSIGSLFIAFWCLLMVRDLLVDFLENDVAIGAGFGPGEFAELTSLPDYIDYIVAKFGSLSSAETNKATVASLRSIKRSLQLGMKYNKTARATWYEILRFVKATLESIEQRHLLLDEHEDALRAAGSYEVAERSLVEEIAAFSQQLVEMKTQLYGLRASALPRGTLEKILSQHAETAQVRSSDADGAIALAPEFRRILTHIGENIDVILTQQNDPSDERVYRAKQTRERYLRDTFTHYTAMQCVNAEIADRNLRNDLALIADGVAEDRASFTNDIIAGASKNSQFLQQVFRPADASSDHLTLFKS